MSSSSLVVVEGGVEVEVGVEVGYGVILLFPVGGGVSGWSGVGGEVVDCR